MLLAARCRVEHQRTVILNPSNALVQQAALGIDACKALTHRQAREIRDWRARYHDTVDQRVERAEAIDLAKAIKVRLKVIEVELVDLDQKLARNYRTNLVWDQ